MEEIDLKELFNMFWSRKMYIAIIVIFCFIIGVLYSYLFVKPVYQSSTTIILAQSGAKNEDDAITTSDLTLNQKLVSTYSELIKSKNILSEVIENLKLDKSEGALKGNISVTSVKDTDLIRITVTDEDPELSQKIASEIADVFIEKVAKETYNIKNVQVWDKAEVPTRPSNVHHKKNVAIFVVAGVVISAIYVIIANMLDVTVKSKEDIESKIGLSVLTIIPVCGFDIDFQTQKGGKK